jgi:AraC-like DNA-binding protein
MPNQKFYDFGANYLALKKQAELEFAGKVTDELVWKERRHEHVDLCEIALVVQGSGCTFVDETPHPFTAGDLLVYNERVMHFEDWTTTTDPPILYYMVIKNFSVEGMAENKLLPDGVSPVFSTRGGFAALRGLFEALLDECEVQELGHEVAASGLLQAILIRSLRIVNDQFQMLRSGSSNSLGFRIREYIEKNYMENLTLTSIATHFFISQFYLQHLFKDTFGDSPINYLIRFRLERAKRLLTSTKHSVKTVAGMCGYESVPYFCLAFKKATGLTPTEYRNQRHPPPG